MLNEKDIKEILSDKFNKKELKLNKKNNEK